MRFTRNEFHKSAARTTAESKDFLLKSILLPVGAISLGVLVAKKLTGSHHAPDHDNDSISYQTPTVEREKPAANWFSKFMLVALPFVQQFFLSLKSNEEATEEGVDGNGHYTSKSNDPASLLATAVPLVIPILQQYFSKIEEDAKEQVVRFDSDGNEVPAGATITPKDGASAIFESLFRLLPVVLPLVQQFLATPKKPAETYAQEGRYAEAMA